jgi:hypothetical protein
MVLHLFFKKVFNLFLTLCNKIYIKIDIIETEHKNVVLVYIVQDS